MKKYCEFCKKEVNTKIVSKKETFNVLGEEIEVESKVLICGDCNSEIFFETLDNETLIKAYDEYRIRHKLLLPREITQIREMYGLSQRSFAKLLNWGDKTIHRYENGAIQDKAHNSLLLFLKNPINMKSYLNENEITFEEDKLQKLRDLVDCLIQEKVDNNSFDSAEMWCGDEPTIENGYKEFDYNKFAAMVQFYASKKSELLKTKLMKLLSYADNLFFKGNAISISGSRYLHLPYGPVPERFDVLLERLQSDKKIMINIEYYGGYEKHIIESLDKDNKSVLNQAEIDILEKVYSKFESYSSSEISNRSHTEKGYQNTKQGEIISYSYARYMNIDDEQIDF